MTESPKEDLEAVTQAVTDLYESTVRDEDAGAAAAAAANLHSASGFLHADKEVLDVFDRAIEIGYAAALRDVREGHFDEGIRAWRPGLFEG
ncbi:hypothetical protein MUU72_10585 [Streptomyces sp. RS10V-4]|uniref:hypothetical protein n=1 Tax=Streptomyces rhizoryzae TaxID=2932493 RepID=UPI002003EE8B|nr:hypothetical protein [Streptomyces rhizoryzae]MCK7623534.1 hypothetical protein [Streptomyces rhizoryzae]